MTTWDARRSIEFFTALLSRAIYYRHMALNPYASFLGDRDPVEVIASTPTQLARLSETLGVKRMEHSPAPGKWNAREILCHLADCETVFAFRLRQTLAEDNPVIQPFDQDKWAAPYSSYTAAEAMAAFSSLRQWNLTLIRNLPREAFAKKVKHPERGEMTFKTIVETMAGHDTNHLRQVEAIATRFATVH
ncbi:MAG TPA: DinB family protein [Terriglobales bacterium]|nr:DinB family protein [Terriglobales bacterium]